MVYVFFAVMGTMAVIGLFIFDMERKRRRMLDLLTRLEHLGNHDKTWRLRGQNLRRLTMSRKPEAVARFDERPRIAVLPGGELWG